jgi:hypothetical protein
MYNTALNNLIWGKPLRNLEMRAKTTDQPGNVYKTVDPMKKRRIVRKGQYLVPGIFKAHRNALYSFIGQAMRWGPEMRSTNPHQPQNHIFILFVYTPSFLHALEFLEH